MSATAVLPDVSPAFDQARLLREAEQTLRHPGATVTAVGSRPWHQRALARLLSPAAVIMLSMAALTPLQLGVGTLAVGGAVVGKAAMDAHQASQVRLGQAQPMLMSPVALRPWFNPGPQASTAPVASAAAFEVPVGMAPQQVALKLFDLNKPFQALAVTLEGLETKPYRDGCGLNVGMGYCIDARVREHGTARVRQDLLGAGLTGLQTDALLGNDRPTQDSVELSGTQALALLALTEGDYRNRARTFVGGKTFDGLPAHRQAVLTWLSYNTGEGLGNFRSLLTAVRLDQPGEAVQHMTPYFSQGGQMVPNARAGSWLMAAYWSVDSMKAALSRPDALERGARQGQSPLEVVAPKDAGRLALLGALPPSPYVAHGLAELSPVAAPVQTASVAPVPSAVEEATAATLPSLAEWRRSRRGAEGADPAPQAAQGPGQTAEADNGLGLDISDLAETLPSAPQRRGPRL